MPTAYEVTNANKMHRTNGLSVLQIYNRVTDCRANGLTDQTRVKVGVLGVNVMVRDNSPLCSPLAIRNKETLNSFSYTVFQKKEATKLLAITLSNLDRFSKFFHC